MVYQLRKIQGYGFEKNRLGKFDVLYEKWFWEGILGESIIFADSDISGMTDDEIEQEVRKSPLVKKVRNENKKVI